MCLPSAPKAPPPPPPAPPAPQAVAQATRSRLTVRSRERKDEQPVRLTIPRPTINLPT